MFKAAIMKEFRLVARDWHSLLVLFVMPAVFIIIMSLAMQRQFGEHQSVSYDAVLIDADDSALSQQLQELLETSSLLQFEAPSESKKRLLMQVETEKLHLLVYIPKHFSTNFDDAAEQSFPVEVYLAPSINEASKMLITAALREAYAKTRLNRFLADLNGDETMADDMEDIVAQDAIRVEYAFGDERKVPSAVQQSVPAWLVFAMFFVVIPVSTTLINERQLGTLARLKSMSVSPALFLLAKVIPYLVINQVQLIVMLLIGVYIVPLLGGDTLSLGHSYIGIVLLSLAVGIAAMGFALLIAVSAKTTEQATSLGGVGNILCGALGGIMVPKFIMPDAMQQATMISPMSWGLEGFLDLFLRQGSVVDIVPELGVLVSFGIALGMLALFLFRKVV